MADLAFIASLLFSAVMLIRLIWLAIRGQWLRFRATAGLFAAYVTAYAAALVALALITPRRVLAPGERKCFDDWCVAVEDLAAQPSNVLCPGAEGAVWVATIEVSSVAKRVHQRAADASPEFEDTAGSRYPPCAAMGARTIRDMLGPGESFKISVPFAVGTDMGHASSPRLPAGLVIWHGRFPGLIIAGDDQSWLHQPTLFRANVR